MARVHFVPFVHSQSYRPIGVHVVPIYHLAGDPLELPQGPLGVPGQDPTLRTNAISIGYEKQEDLRACSYFQQIRCLHSTK